MTIIMRMLGMADSLRGALGGLWALNWLAKFSGFLGPFGPILAAVGSALVQAIVRFAKVFGRGVAICVANPATFTVMFASALAGGWYFGEWDPLGARSAKHKIAALQAEIRSLEKTTGVKRPSRRGKARTRATKSSNPVDYIMRQLGGW